MSCTRRSARISAIICFLLMFFAVTHFQDFLDQEAWGQTMLLISLGAAFLVFPGAAVKWELGTLHTDAAAYGGGALCDAHRS